MRKMKKEKVRYHVLFVPDKDTQAVKFSVSLGVLVIFFMAVVFVTIQSVERLLCKHKNVRPPRWLSL